MQLALVRGCTGACNAVNTTLTTDAQLQKLEEWLLGALGLAEELRSPAAPCLKASPFMRWDQSKHLVAILSCITTKVFPPHTFFSKKCHTDAFSRCKILSLYFKTPLPSPGARLYLNKNSLTTSAFIVSLKLTISASFSSRETLSDI